MPPKRKGKGRAAAEPTGHDDLVEAASYQEDQATRYQFGDKAQRHYEEAARLYAAAAQIPGLAQQEQYDAKYNHARVLYTLATEIYGPPDCYDTLLQAIDAFRSCGTYSISDKIDGAFNLAQALQTLGEYVSESVASSSIRRLASPETIWTEAIQILEAVVQQQLSRLSSASSHIATSVDEDLETDMGSSAETGAIEEQIVTPSTIIETILACVQARLSVAETSRSLDEEKLEGLLQSALELDAVGGYMASEIRTAKQEVIRLRTRLQIDRGDTPSAQDLQSVLEEQRQVMASLRRPDPAAVSDLADTIILAAETMLAGSALPTHAIELLQEATSLYNQARTILNNPLQRPASTPAHHVPALLSANFQSSAHACTLLALLDSVEGQHSQPQLARAKELALESLNCTEGPFKALPATSDGLVKFAKALRSAQRNDYRTVSATRDAVLAIVRIFLLDRMMQGESQPFGEQERGLHALLKATWSDPNDLKQVIGEYLEVLQSDGVGRLLFQIFNTSEQPIWEDFINAAL